MKISVVVIALISILHVQATPLPASPYQEKLSMSQIGIRNNLSAIPGRHAALEPEIINASDERIEPEFFKVQSQYLENLQTADESAHITRTKMAHSPGLPPSYQKFWSITGLEAMPGLQKISQKNAFWISSFGANSDLPDHALTYDPVVISKVKDEQSNEFQSNQSPVQEINNIQFKLRKTPKNSNRIHIKRSDQPTSTSSVQEESKFDSHVHLGPSDLAVLLSLLGFALLAILTSIFGTKLKQKLTFWKKG
ncbi:hypothetical protein DFH28DRAFT_881463 [Melampsora americana]|nr:hypothetical protein DFH28DRAFT_881463 [Melampsora americana]